MFAVSLRVFPNELRHRHRQHEEYGTQGWQETLLRAQASRGLDTVLFGSALRCTQGVWLLAHGFACGPALGRDRFPTGRPHYHDAHHLTCTRTRTRTRCQCTLDVDTTLKNHLDQHTGMMNEPRRKGIKRKMHL